MTETFCVPLQVFCSLEFQVKEWRLNPCSQWWETVKIGSY